MMLKTSVVPSSILRFAKKLLRHLLSACKRKHKTSQFLSFLNLALSVSLQDLDLSLFLKEITMNAKVFFYVSFVSLS